MDIQQFDMGKNTGISPMLNLHAEAPTEADLQSKLKGMKHVAETQWMDWRWWNGDTKKRWIGLEQCYFYRYPRCMMFEASTFYHPFATLEFVWIFPLPRKVVKTLHQHRSDRKSVVFYLR